MIGYQDICEAKTKREMVRRFEVLLKEVAKRYGSTPESHRATQLSNVGYCSGYYDQKTAKRILDWLGARHPIFGSSHADGTLKPGYYDQKTAKRILDWLGLKKGHEP